MRLSHSSADAVHQLERAPRLGFLGDDGLGRRAGAATPIRQRSRLDVRCCVLLLQPRALGYALLIWAAQQQNPSGR